MTAKEYDDINPFFNNLEQLTINKCNESGVNFWNYISFVDFDLKNYITCLNKIITVSKMDFDCPIKTRAILNKKHFGSKEEEIKNLVLILRIKRKKLYDWLDKTKDPYFFIMNNVYRFGCYGGVDQYKHIEYTGSKNYDIAIEYSKHKLKTT